MNEKMKVTFKFRKNSGDRETYIVLAVDETAAWVGLAQRMGLWRVTILEESEAKERLSGRFTIVPANKVREQLYADHRAKKIARRVGVEV